MCIQAITPTHASSASASISARRIAAVSVSTGLLHDVHRHVVGAVEDPATSPALAATWSIVSSPYRCWLPVRNQISRESYGALIGWALLAVDVLVPVVEGSTSAGAMATGSPSWRARCTVRATSSTMTAAFTRPSGRPCR